MPSSLQSFLFKGQPCLCLRLETGQEALLSLYGGQLLSWQTVSAQGAKVEQLYLSPKAVFDGRTAIRGGVPICFPQFNQRGLSEVLLPKHGFARIVSWRRLDGSTHLSTKHASVQLILEPNDLPDQLRLLWPHRFQAKLELRLRDNELSLIVSVQNLDASSWPFALALHSYLRTSEIQRTRLNGLQGRDYWDAVADPGDPAKTSTEPRQALEFQGETDRVYQSGAEPLVLDKGLGRLRIVQSPSFSETVVWNPGASLCAQLPDMPTEGYREMLCVEAAKIDQAITLLPGQVWSGSQTLTVLTD
jgi:glucose-6-phosphate 1-epimerase